MVRSAYKEAKAQLDKFEAAVRMHEVKGMYDGADRARIVAEYELVALEMDMLLLHLTRK